MTVTTTLAIITAFTHLLVLAALVSCPSLHDRRGRHLGTASATKGGPLALAELSRVVIMAVVLPDVRTPVTATVGDAEVVASCYAVHRFGTWQEEPIVLNWRLGQCKKTSAESCRFHPSTESNRSSEKLAKPQSSKDVAGHGHERRCFDSGSDAQARKLATRSSSSCDSARPNTHGC